MTRRPKIYVLYEDDEVIAVGTANQLAELLGCRVQRVYQYACVRTKHRYAVLIDDLAAMDMFANKNTETMATVCARIIRATRGRCRESGMGCDDIGWCEPCYRAACKLVAERKRGGNHGR